jgi:uncharacterized protein
MSIDWQSFTPYAALAGGVLIGAAASMLLLFNGRVAGISGIIGGLFKPAAGDAWWRIAFVAGLILAPLAYTVFAKLPESRVDTGFVATVIAGLLVGIGTRYGAGCTSGHGVCGLSRLSPRSLVATLAFMATGLASVFVSRHVMGA